MLNTNEKHEQNQIKMRTYKIKSSSNSEFTTA